MKMLILCLFFCLQKHSAGQVAQFQLPHREPRPARPAGGGPARVRVQRRADAAAQEEGPAEVRKCSFCVIYAFLQGLLYHRTCKPDFLGSWPSLNSYLK